MRPILPFVMLGLAWAAPADARDTVLRLDLQPVLEPAYSGGRLDGSVRFFLEGQTAPTVVKDFGEAITSRKTNAFGKSDATACKWAMLSALLALQAEAKARGANAVVGITSFYDRKTWSSDTKYECHAGGLMAGVALKGVYATVDEH